MSAENQDIPWQEGFKAAALVGSRCPYSSWTAEAEAWECGWLAGIVRREAKDTTEPGAWDRVTTILNNTGKKP
jgi:hypothetical protein